MLALTLLLAPALADVAIPPPTGRIFVSHELAIEGLAEHPEVAIVAFDGEPGGTIGTYRVLRSDTEQPVQLAWGGSNRGPTLGNPGLYLMKLEAFNAWQSATAATVMEQRAACERGEGCAHISRFEPSYAAPTEVVSCDTKVELVSTAIMGSSEQVVSSYKLVEATDTTCKLEAVKPAKGASAKGKAPGAGCAHAPTGAASALLGLGLLLALGRRRP